MAGAGTGREAARGTSAPKTTTRVMKEARKDELHVGKHFYSIADVNSHYEREQMIQDGCSGPLVRGPVGALGWGQELTLECKVFPTFWKVLGDPTLDCYLQTTRLLEAKSCSYLGYSRASAWAAGGSARGPCTAWVAVLSLLPHHRHSRKCVPSAAKG